MREAARLAQEGMDTGKGGPFGAVIVENGQIIGRGCNLVTSANDPTAHAEVTAIRQACAARGDFSLAGCELYTSCEPCPMCLAAIYWARLDRIYYANTRDDAARIGFDDALIYKEVALPTEARTLPMHPLPLKEALAAFEAWASKPDKTDY
jgi:tRNA(Arg) A34 adenosine deaminase TadA